MIRTQAPLIRTINDDPAIWAAMWRTQVRMGMVPYYMFVERDTGPQDYFAVPLATAHGIFSDAYRQVAGLCRTVRGPSMSSTPGKVCVDGIADVAGQRVFVLHMIQARDPDLVGEAVLRPLRPGRHLAHRPAARVRQPLPVRGRPRGPAGPLVPGDLRAGQLSWPARPWPGTAGLRPPGRLSCGRTSGTGGRPRSGGRLAPLSRGS